MSIYEKLMMELPANPADSNHGICLSEITALPANATFSSVIDKFGLIPTDMVFLLFYPASEGGEYLFLFFPTNEVTSPKFDTSSDDLPLIAVVKLDNRNDFEAGKGTYVFPKTVAGKTCTGLDDENIIFTYFQRQ